MGNCYPGLEFDLRQLDTRFFPGLTFDFLGITDASNERTIEKALLLRLRDFLIELGVGFAFVGSQYRLEVEGDEFFMDLLFYHTRLHCYVVIELKNTAFRPEYVGKLNFYLAAVDELVRNQTVDAPTIGLVLCKSKKGTVVEVSTSSGDRLKVNVPSLGLTGWVHRDSHWPCPRLCLWL